MTYTCPQCGPTNQTADEHAVDHGAEPITSTVDEAPGVPWLDISPKARRRELAHRLADLADQLGGAYNAMVERLERDMPGVDAFTVVDSNGAPVLAPTLAAMGHTLAALAALELAER